MNQNLKSGLVALVVTLVLSGLGWLMGGKTETALTPAQQTAITDTLTRSLSSLVTNAVQSNVPRTGALSGPEIPSPYLQWGAINHWAAGGISPLATTTSSVFCTIALPYGTTTIDRVSWRPDSLSGISSTAVFDVSTSTNMNATTSPALLVGAPIVTSQNWIAEASSSNALAPSVVLQGGTASGALNVFTVFSSPNNPLYLIFKISSTTATNLTIPSTLAGNCEYEGTQL